MNKAVGLLILLLFSNLTMLKAQFDISADISPRAELRHGFRTMPAEDDKPAANINQRTRLIFGWKSENLRTQISFQDVRVWGMEPQKQANPSLAIHEAWAELLFNPVLSLKLGRQEVRYDNQRFLAVNDWIPMAQKHDLALLKWESGKNKLHFGTAFNQEWAAFDRNFETEYRINNYKYMNFLWFNTGLGANGSISLLGIADGYEDVTNNGVLQVRGTWSVFLKYKLGRFDLMINPALQNGKTREGTDISAYYFRTEAGTKLTGKLLSTLGIEMLSGNDPDDANTFRVFDPTHGAGHVNSGYMDYFTNYPAHTRGAGLINPFIKNNITINSRTSMEANFNLFYIQNTYRNFDEEINKYLGSEIDLVLNYKFNDFTLIQGGFSTMFGTESMEIIKSGSKDEPAYFGYIMMRIRPKFL
jgi:hypothetical protein